MSIGYHSPLSHLETYEVDRAAWQAEQDRAAAEAWKAEILAAARKGDGWCFGLSEAARLGHWWNNWLPGSGGCCLSAKNSAENFEAAFAARAEQNARAAQVAAADPALAPKADLVARWVEHGPFGIKGKEARLIKAWLDAISYTPSAAPINNPFAALAAWKKS